MLTVANEILGRRVIWYGNRGQESGIIVAIGYTNSQFVLLINTDEGLKQKNIDGVRLD